MVNIPRINLEQVTGLPLLDNRTAASEMLQPAGDVGGSFGEHLSGARRTPTQEYETEDRERVEPASPQDDRKTTFDDEDRRQSNGAASEYSRNDDTGTVDGGQFSDSAEEAASQETSENEEPRNADDRDQADQTADGDSENNESQQTESKDGESETGEVANIEVKDSELENVDSKDSDARYGAAAGAEAAVEETLVKDDSPKEAADENAKAEDAAKDSTAKESNGQARHAGESVELNAEDDVDKQSASQNDKGDRLQRHVDATGNESASQEDAAKETTGAAAEQEGSTAGKPTSEAKGSGTSELDAANQNQSFSETNDANTGNQAGALFGDAHNPEAQKESKREANGGSVEAQPKRAVPTSASTNSGPDVASTETADATGPANPVTASTPATTSAADLPTGVEASTPRANANNSADTQAASAVRELTGQTRGTASTSQAPAEDGGEGVDAARFVQRVARAFRTMGDRDGSVRLRLSPPELGSLRLEIAVRNGAMTAKVEAETATARTLLLDNLPALRERLAEQDIKVEQFDVSLSDRSAGGSPEQTAQQAENRQRGQGGGGSSTPSESEREEQSEAETRVPGGSGEGTQLNIVV